MQVCLVRLSGEVLARYDAHRLDMGLDLADYAAPHLGLSIEVKEEVWAEVDWKFSIPSLGTRVDLLWGDKRLSLLKSLWESGLPVRATVVAAARDRVFYRLWFASGLSREEFWDCPLAPEEPLSTLACRWASRFHNDGHGGGLRLEAADEVALPSLSSPRLSDLQQPGAPPTLHAVLPDA